MDDLYALDGGAAATKWKKRRAKRKKILLRNRRNRDAHDERHARWVREERRKSRVGKIESEQRSRKMRRRKLTAKIEKDDRRAFLKSRKAEGYRNPHLPYKDITGRRYGRLTVIKPGGHNPSGSKRWWVKCDCGSPMKEIAGTNLKQGILRSCGCLLGEQIRKAGDRKRAARAKIIAGQIRSALAKWKQNFCDTPRDERFLRHLESVLGWAEAERAARRKPRLRQIPTMREAFQRAKRRPPKGCLPRTSKSA